VPETKEVIIMQTRLKPKRFTLVLVLAIIGCTSPSTPTPKTAVINFFKPTVNEVAFQQEVTLTWDVTGGETCSVAFTSETGEQSNFANLPCQGGQHKFALAHSTTFQLMATPGSARADTKVTVDYLSPEKTNLGFSSVVGETANEQTLLVKNNTDFERSFSIENKPTWLSVTPGSSLIPAGESVSLVLSVEACSAVGTDEETFRILSPDDANVSSKSEDSILVTRECKGSLSFDQKLTAFDTEASDALGTTVSISGNTAIVGAPRDDDKGIGSGSAYIFVQSNNSWTQQAKLTTTDGAETFGFSVAIRGDTAIVGAPRNEAGSAYIFVRNDDTWTQQTKLTATDSAVDDFFGVSVAISGETVLIGALKDDDKGESSGSAYIFQRLGGAWVQQAKLTADDGAAGDVFGSSVALSEDTAIVGAFGDDDTGERSGSAYSFVRRGDAWTQQAKLTADDGEATHFFGTSVSLSGNTAIVGANDFDRSDASGAAYIFVRSGDTWTQQTKLNPNDGAGEDAFGTSVAVSEDTVIVGAPGDDDKGKSSGSAYIFVRSRDKWIQQNKLTALDGAIGDGFGESVALSENTAIVGVPGNDDRGEGSGAVYVFSR
jgi:FG-GAP repeat